MQRVGRKGLHLISGAVIYWQGSGKSSNNKFTFLFSSSTKHGQLLVLSLCALIRLSLDHTFLTERNYLHYKYEEFLQ